MATTCIRPYLRLPLLFLIFDLLLIQLCTLPQTGALNVRSLREASSSASGTAAAESLTIEKPNLKKARRGILSKLERSHPSPSAASRWESSKSKVDELASFVEQRASAYSAWLKSNNLNPATDGSAQLMKQFNDLNKAQVVSSGKSLSDFQVPVTVGSEGQAQKLKLDTSTGLSWIQCEPCEKCFEQPEDVPVYNTSASETFHAVGCDNRICTEYNGAVNYSCVTAEHDGSKVCGYSTKYLDGSSSSGTVSLEYISLQASEGETLKLSEWVFGCGHNQQGSFGDGQTGVLGMDRSDFSFIKQLSQSEGYGFARSFAYCLPDRVPKSTSTSDAGEDSGSSASGGAGHIIFGPTDGYYSDDSFLYTPLKTNDIYPTLYSVDLKSITVHDNATGFSQAVSGFDSDGHTATLTTGVDGLWVPEKIYDVLIAAFLAGTKDLPKDQDAQAVTKLGPCYIVSEDDSTSYLSVPSLKFSFAGTDESAGTLVELEVPRDNYFIPVNAERSVFCYAVHKQETGSLTVIGHNVVANYVVKYDLDKNLVGILANQGCVLPEPSDDDEGSDSEEGNDGEAEAGTGGGDETPAADQGGEAGGGDANAAGEAQGDEASGGEAASGEQAASEGGEAASGGGEAASGGGEAASGGGEAASGEGSAV